MVFLKGNSIIIHCTSLWLEIKWQSSEIDIHPSLVMYRSQKSVKSFQIQVVVRSLVIYRISNYLLFFFNMIVARCFYLKYALFVLLLVGLRQFNTDMIYYFGISFLVEISCFWNTYNHSQNIWYKLYISCEITHYRRSSITVFQEIFGSTDKNFILGGGINTRQQFYEVLSFSCYFLIS